jgi:hypothetical protein
MKNDSQAEIRRMIDDFAAQLEATLRRIALEQVLATLQGDLGSAAVRRGPGRPKGSGRGPGRPAGSKNKRGRRSSEGLDVMQGKLLAHVKSNPGQRGDQIAAAFGTDAKTIRPAMQRLIADKKVKSRGQRRGMTYAAV